MASGGFGSLPFGSDPFGSGEVFSIEFTSCIVRGANEIWVTIDSLSGLRPSDASSELNAKNWTLSSLSVDGFPRFVQNIVAVETESEAASAGASLLFDLGFFPALRVFTDGPLSADRDYILSYSGLGSQTCQIRSLLVDQFAIEKSSTENMGTVEDFKNPQVSKDKLPLGSLGAYNITDQGDLAIDNGSESLRKRILRRIVTSVAGFYHLPNYGTNLESKSSVTPDLARRIKDRVKNGVREEPDVLTASTNVYPVRGEEGMIVVQVTATTVFGETITVSEQVRVSG